jgi:hypothetical protein
VHRLSLNLVSPDALDTIPAAMRCAASTRIVASLDELHRALEDQATHPRDAATALDIDLIGHSTRDHHLLRVGATVIDTLDLGVRRFFEQLARTGLLGAVNAASLRLLGCETAVSPSGQRTLRTLAAVLQLPVHGTRKRLFKSYYSAQGLQPQFRSVLFEGCPSGRRSIRSALTATGLVLEAARYPRPARLPACRGAASATVAALDEPRASPTRGASLNTACPAPRAR